MPENRRSVEPRPTQHWGLITAAALCWTWGVMFMAFYLPSFLGSIREGQPRSRLMSEAAVAIVFVAISWLTAYGIAKRSRVGAIAAVLISAIGTIPLLSPPDFWGIIIAAMNVVIIGLVVVNWREFTKRAPSHVGA